MTGRIVAEKNGYFEVVCPDAPAHLTPLYLIRQQLKGAGVGDTVRLEYQVTSRGGLWNVVEVLRSASELDLSALRKALKTIYTAKLLDAISVLTVKHYKTPSRRALALICEAQAEILTRAKHQEPK